MAREFSKKTAPEPLLAAWIKWTMDFWDAMAQMGPGLVSADQTGKEASREAAVAGDRWMSSLKLWQAFFSLMTEPGTVATVFQGIKAPSEIILRMAQAGWGGYFYLHQQWLEGWQEDLPVTGDYGYENLDQDIFKICNEIYENDFRQLMNLPHLGLAGHAQEDLSWVTEKFHQFQAAMAEFIYLLFLPMKKSLRAMRGVGGSGRQEKPPEDFKEYYKGWLKILEGHYMTLFQSAEFSRTLCHTLNALEDFNTAKEELLAKSMAALALPSRRDLDGLYREIYLLKKSMKRMAKKLDQGAPSSEEG